MYERLGDPGAPEGRQASSVIRHFVFPATLMLALAVAYGMLERGLPPQSVIVVWFLLMPLIIMLERVMPRHPEWNENQGDLLTDLIYFPTNLVVAGGLSALWAGLYLTLAAALQTAVGQTVWPSGAQRGAMGRHA